MLDLAIIMIQDTLLPDLQKSKATLIKVFSSQNDQTSCLCKQFITAYIYVLKLSALQCKNNVLHKMQCVDFLDNPL